MFSDMRSLVTRTPSGPEQLIQVLLRLWGWKPHLPNVEKGTISPQFKGNIWRIHYKQSWFFLQVFFRWSELSQIGSFWRPVAAASGPCTDHRMVSVWGPDGFIHEEPETYRRGERTCNEICSVCVRIDPVALQLNLQENMGTGQSLVLYILGNNHP